jgi:acyl-CoA thioesterase-2
MSQEIPIPLDPLVHLLSTLSLERLSDDEFTGPSQWMPHGRVFGGQVLAQCLVAAQSTMDEGRLVHSLHGYFLRAGDIRQPISFSVDRIRDGRSFSTRRVQAFQDGQPIFSMIASFQDEDPGLTHQDDMPAGIPDPETLPSARSLLGDIDHPVAQYWAKARPFDMRHVQTPIYFDVKGEKVAHQAVWIKALGELPVDQPLHTAALAYVSDYTILEPIFRRHGIAWTHSGLKSASLDHAMWFHRPAKVDEWMLYVQESPSAQGGRGLSLGRIFSQDGRLLATVAQEGMVRIPEII